MPHLLSSHIPSRGQHCPHLLSRAGVSESLLQRPPQTPAESGELSMNITWKSCFTLTVSLITGVRVASKTGPDSLLRVPWVAKSPHARSQTRPPGLHSVEGPSKLIWSALGVFVPFTGVCRNTLWLTSATSFRGHTALTFTDVHKPLHHHEISVVLNSFHKLIELLSKSTFPKHYKS